MKKYISLIVIILTLIIIHGCAIKPFPDRGKEIKIKVGIMEGQSSIEFRADESFDIFTHDGSFITSGSAGDRCLVHVLHNKEAQIGYQLLTKTVYNKQVAQKVLSQILAKGFSAVIKEKKQAMVREGRFGKYPIYQVFLERVFESREAAERYRNDISNMLSTIVISFTKKLPTGTIRLENLGTGKVAKSKYYLRVEGNSITLNVKVGAGFHFEKTEIRTYGGCINFVVDRIGKLSMVNELPLEDYLSGVVASEMNPNFPLEALKAQAVTARGFTISQLGKQHPLDPFDLCDEVHCQVFNGITKVSPDVIRAVRETTGKVLMYQDKICETFYFGVCGGHTEHNENVWLGGTPRRYLRGVFDLPLEKAAVDEDFLINEKNLRNWIEGHPNAYCNIKTIDPPPYLEYTQKYFRWEVQYTQSELTGIIEKKTGVDVGTLLDIIPLERGISGRLMKIRIAGSSKSLTIEKDLEIRKALSHDYLYSSCFIVDKVGNSYGAPQKFIIKGAGWGHGVGMCQTGAAVMALKGMNYQKILRHYYRGANIVSIY